MVKFSPQWLDQSDPYGALYGSYILYDPSNTEEVSCSICFYRRIRITSRGLAALRDHAASLKHRNRSLEAGYLPSPKAPAEAEPPSPKALEVAEPPVRTKFNSKWLEQSDPSGALYGSYILYDPSNTEEVSCSICFNRRIRIFSRGLASLREHAETQKHRIRSLEAAYLFGRKTPREAEAEPQSRKAPAEAEAEPPSPKAPAVIEPPPGIKFNPEWLEQSDPPGALYGSYILYDPSNTV